MIALAGKVQAVLGLVDPSDLGITLPHEHILADFNPTRWLPSEASRRARGMRPIQLDDRHRIGIHHDGRDDGLLLDEEEAIAEVGLFKRAGGGTIVEATNIGTGRDPMGLARISRATGVHIVMGSGYYSMDVPQPGLAEKPPEAITEEIVCDIEEGFGWPPVRAGIIGEVASGWPRRPEEEKSLRAAAMAQARTGAALLLHPGRNPRAPIELIRIVIDAGGDPSRTIVSHLERTIFDRQTLEELARTGCGIEYDLFGQEAAHYEYRPSVFVPNDATRLDDFTWLIERGHLDQLFASHDIGSRELLRRYAGHGYAHLIENVAPMMLRKGFTEDHLQSIFIRNPARVLAFAAV